MTESLPPPDADEIDLAASATVDGAPTDPGIGDLDGAAVAARIEAFRSVSDAVADVTVPSSATIDHHIEMALAAFDGSPAADPIPLPSRRGAWSGRRWLAVAAAVAGIALVVPLLNSLRDQTTHQQLTATGAVADSSASGTGTPADADEANGTPSSSSPADAAAGSTPTPSTAGSTGPASLGEVSSEDQLASLVRTSVPALATSDSHPPSSLPGDLPSTTLAGVATTSTAPPSPIDQTTTSASCDASVHDSHPELASPVLVTSVTLRGVFLEVLVYATDASASSAYRLIAATPADCHIVVDRLL